MAKLDMFKYKFIFIQSTVCVCQNEFVIKTFDIYAHTTTNAVNETYCTI